jgi:hypothetical protein
MGFYSDPGAGSPDSVLGIATTSTLVPYVTLVKRADEWP